MNTRKGSSDVRLPTLIWQTSWYPKGITITISQKIKNEMLKQYQTKFYASQTNMPKIEMRNTDKTALKYHQASYGPKTSTDTAWTV